MLLPTCTATKITHNIDRENYMPLSSVYKYSTFTPPYKTNLLTILLFCEFTRSYATEKAAIHSCRLFTIHIAENHDISSSKSTCSNSSRDLS